MLGEVVVVVSGLGRVKLDISLNSDIYCGDQVTRKKLGNVFLKESVLS